MLQVLERDCAPEMLPKKRAKLEGKRTKDYPKVGLPSVLLRCAFAAVLQADIRLCRRRMSVHARPI